MRIEASGSLWVNGRLGAPVNQAKMVCELVNDLTLIARSITSHCREGSERRRGKRGW